MSNSITKREIGFRASGKKSESVTVPSVYEVTETVPIERIFARLVSFISTMAMIFIPVYLAVNYSSWWMLLWLWELPTQVVQHLRFLRH